MKSVYSILVFVLFAFSSLFAQNVDDNKVSFQYIQLPVQKINSNYKTYEVRVNHLYKNANADSLTVFNSRKDATQKLYDAQYAAWLEQKKTLDRTYLNQMAQYEKAINAGTTATLPTAPVYPAAPILNTLDAPKLHAEWTDTEVSNFISIQGYEKGLGGSIATITIHPIRNIKIIETKTGSGATTKYEYKCQYTLPVEVTFETPTEGKLYSKILFDEVRFYTMKSYSSKYEYQAWYLDNGSKFFPEMEREVRKNALNEVNQLLNNEFGFVKTNRTVEIYTVKKYKDYTYTDITEAYTLTTQALSMVGKDRDRTSAKAKIDQSIAKWNAILEESNTYDEKARVNDKITAMIHCNLAELLIWKGDFDAAELHLNLALNSGVLKFRNHAERLQSFMAMQKARWIVHFG